MEPVFVPVDDDVLMKDKTHDENGSSVPAVHKLSVASHENCPVAPTEVDTGASTTRESVVLRESGSNSATDADPGVLDSCGESSASDDETSVCDVPDRPRRVIRPPRRLNLFVAYNSSLQDLPFGQMANLDWPSISC